jgi:hypothetical protein
MFEQTPIICSILSFCVPGWGRRISFWRGCAFYQLLIYDFGLYPRQLPGSALNDRVKDRARHVSWAQGRAEYGKVYIYV